MMQIGKRKLTSTLEVEGPPGKEMLSLPSGTEIDVRFVDRDEYIGWVEYGTELLVFRQDCGALEAISEPSPINGPN